MIYQITIPDLLTVASITITFYSLILNFISREYLYKVLGLILINIAYVVIIILLILSSSILQLDNSNTIQVMTVLLTSSWLFALIILYWAYVQLIGETREERKKEKAKMVPTPEIALKSLLNK